MKALVHGGFKGLPENAWRTYFTEMFRGGGKAFAAADTLNIVLVPWANSPKQWPNMAKKLAERCTKYWPGVTCHIHTAHTPQELVQLSHTADVVYCPGGIFMNNITQNMRQVREALLQSHVKVFTGFSAGAYALVTHYYDAKRQQPAQGGGLFEAAVCCHYTDARASAKQLLEEGAKQTPHLLADGGFVWLSCS